MMLIKEKGWMGGIVEVDSANVNHTLRRRKPLCRCQLESLVVYQNIPASLC